DPAREFDQVVDVAQRYSRLLAQLSRAGPAQCPGPTCRVLGAAVAVIDRSAGEDPDATHELRLGGALHEQNLEGLLPAAQHDHGCCLARVGGGARVVFGALASARSLIDVHRMTLAGR